MPLAQSQHGHVLRFIVKRIEGLQTQASYRIERFAGHSWRADHVNQKWKGVEHTLAEHDGIDAEVVGLHIGSALHAEAIECIAVLSAGESARAAEDKFAEQGGVAVAAVGIGGGAHGQKPVQSGGVDRACGHGLGHQGHSALEFHRHNVRHGRAMITGYRALVRCGKGSAGPSGAAADFAGCQAR